MRGKGKWRVVGADAARVIDAAIRHSGRRLKRRIAADLDVIADAEPLYIAARAAADHRVGLI